jgi:CelD/BcsL family acetyltransferase involved in cellulose biosynthesis
MPHTITQITTQIIQNYNSNDITELFAQLGESASESPFLSAAWLVTWLESIEEQERPHLLTVKQKTQLLGFALWGEQRDLFGKTFYLNQSGEHLNDQVWIEHNDIIYSKALSAEERQSVASSMISELSHAMGASKIVVRNTSSNQWSHPQFLSEVTTEESAYASLNPEGKAIGEANFIASLSKNTRSSVKRSNKLIEHEHGPIKVDVVDLEKEPEVFNDVSQIHLERWGRSDFGSGFNNPKFVHFHKKLLSNSYGNLSATQRASFQAPSFKTSFLKITAGNTLLGYLYMLETAQQALFYLSAIKMQTTDNKIKPGLSMHCAAIEYYEAQGFTQYDFLAGQARYKTQMSNAHYPVYQVDMYKRTWRNHLLLSAKQIKNCLSKRPSN